MAEEQAVSTEVLLACALCTMDFHFSRASTNFGGDNV